MLQPGNVFGLAVGQHHVRRTTGRNHHGACGRGIVGGRRLCPPIPANSPLINSATR